MHRTKKKIQKNNQVKVTSNITQQSVVVVVFLLDHALDVAAYMQATHTAIRQKTNNRSHFLFIYLPVQTMPPVLGNAQECEPLQNFRLKY